MASRSSRTRANASSLSKELQKIEIVERRRLGRIAFARNQLALFNKCDCAHCKSWLFLLWKRLPHFESMLYEWNELVLPNWETTVQVFMDFLAIQYIADCITIDTGICHVVENGVIKPTTTLSRTLCENKSSEPSQKRNASIEPSNTPPR